MCTFSVCRLTRSTDSKQHLRTYMYMYMDMGKNAFFLYNDYKNAFQDVAQVGGLEAGLWAAKVPHKGIAIFRLIHAFVGGIVQLRSAAGVIRSKIPFKPTRGGLAGSITMPSMFNCAVANMLRQRDTNRKGGVGPGEADLGLPTKECIVCYARYTYQHLSSHL
eukprot:COSAG01_NODE_2066_length_8507_cov_3.752141_1_plen_163_part_00